MQKVELLRSVFIGFQEDGTPGEVQIQRIERWIDVPEGAAIPDNYLPVERMGYTDLSAAQRKMLKVVMGTTAAALAEELAQVQGQMAELITTITEMIQERDGMQAQISEHRARTGELEVTLQAHELALTQAEAYIGGLMTEAERRESTISELTGDLELFRNPVRDGPEPQPLA